MQVGSDITLPKWKLEQIIRAYRQGYARGVETSGSADQEAEAWHESDKAIDDIKRGVI